MTRQVIQIRYPRVTERKRAVTVGDKVVGHLTETKEGSNVWRADAALKRWLKGHKTTGPTLFPSSDAARQAINVRVRQLAWDEHRKDEKS